MKKHLILPFAGSIFAFSLVSGQPDITPTTVPLPEGYVLVAETNSLTKFDLDFPGGSPAKLVKAIEKATDKPLNVIIPEENADLKIPPISVKNVTVAQLFGALRANSTHHERRVWRAFSDSTHQETLSNPITYYERAVSYGFQTTGAPNDHSIWFLYSDGNVDQIEPKVCRFFQMGPYLGAGYTEDDIRSTIETGWKMLGISRPPEISYDKSTRVLTAAGEIDKVDLIGDLLNQLSKGKPNDKHLAEFKGE